MSTPLKELKQRLKGLQEQIQTESKKFFTEAAKAIFEAYPELDKFSWTQYTPYFNDGDECVFSTNTDNPDLNGKDEYSKDLPVWHKEAAKAVRALLREIEEDTFKAMFGDHCEVTCNRDGVVVEDYSHD